jgi:small-conductance mechanosensitive channel
MALMRTKEFPYRFLIMDIMNNKAILSMLNRISAWWHHDVWQTSTAVQLGVLLSVLLLAVLLGRPLRAYMRKLAVRIQSPGLSHLVIAFSNVSIALAWLFFQLIGTGIAQHHDLPYGALRIVSSLLTAWIVIRLLSHLIRDSGWSRFIAASAWIIAAMNIVGVLDDVVDFLDKFGLSIGDVDLTVLGIIKGALVVALLLWLAGVISEVAEKRINIVNGITPSSKALIAKMVKIIAVTLAILIGMDSVGIHLTSLAIFSGALGVGLGFGLQKIFSNLVSGFILLLDKSIKPGDVIAISGTYGWINALGARYVSVVTRDGVEHLIPNEELIIQRVENWSHSNSMVRLRIPVSISYDSDLRLAIRLCLESLEGVDRVLDDPAPRCLVKAFGDSSVDLEIRLWINDPQNGRSNMISQIYLKIWDMFHEHGISIPYPQRDLHVKSFLGEETSDKLLGGYPKES